MDTNSFPDNSRRRTIWITIIIVLAVAIIALIVSLLTSGPMPQEVVALAGGDEKTNHIEDQEDDICVEIIDEYCDEDIPLDSLRDKDGIYLLVPEGPDYPGGPSALFAFINNTMVYPAQAVKDSIQGRVIVQFIVEEDGSITNPVVVKSSGLNRNQAYSSIFNQMDAEALRIVSAMPKWNPGKIEGKPCRVKYSLPINFRFN